MLSLFDETEVCLQSTDPLEKIRLSQHLQQSWLNGELSIENPSKPQAIGEAGRPAKPELVRPRDVPRRNINTNEGRVILAHALAHIEFNAINLALDAVYRFRDMPAQYYTDWLKVAAEEAYHFSLLNDYIEKRSHAYGDYPAHHGLWEMAQNTAHDVMIRMALVPRVLEARGLDVTPGILKKLASVKDEEFIAHLEIIQADEIGHVAIGNQWFRYCCEQRGIDARKTFKQLIQNYMKGQIRGPFDEVARLQAGFTQQEIDDLNELELDS